MVANSEVVQFNYGDLDDETRVFLQGKTSETRDLLKRASDDIIQIGRNLLEAKAKLPQGQFIPWAKSELGISQPTAWRFMQVAKGKPVKSFNVNDLVVLPPVERSEDNNGRVKLRSPKEVVKQFFEDFPNLHELSNREIAKRTGTTEGTVRNIRKELFPPASEPEVSSDPTPEPEPEPALIIMAAPEIKPIVEPAPALEATLTPDASPIVAVEPLAPSEPPIEAVVTPEVEPASVPKEIDSPLPKIQPSEAVLLARDIRRQEVQERNEQLKEKGVDLPKGKYACLVVDPPWPMQKIEREARPNQIGFDYPTMNEEELRKFEIPEMADENCHLYLWTTQKYLPMALRLAEHWGFKYQCLMTWVKNVGPTPFAWMYSTEHVLFCTKGSLPLLEQGRRLDFSAKVREHSRKPDEFYDLVRVVSPGPRIDVFSREKRDGFDQYGNEVEKFAACT